MEIFIKKYRKEKGLTQIELAKKIGVSQPTIADWERGVTIPTLANAKRTAEALNIPISKLIR